MKTLEETARIALHNNIPQKLRELKKSNRIKSVLVIVFIWFSGLTIGIFCTLSYRDIKQPVHTSNKTNNFLYKYRSVNNKVQYSIDGINWINY